jgi:hypothetical protein
MDGFGLRWLSGGGQGGFEMDDDGKGEGVIVSVRREGVGVLLR